jgi:exodeoxyribonuclease III
MRIVTLNVNGIRSAASKGLGQWLSSSGADMLCVQEVKAQPDVMSEALAKLAGYTGHFHFAARPGYSGCAIYTRRQPDATRQGFGSQEFDAEGRYVQADFGPLSVISVYFPSGSSSEERQQAKFRFLAEFVPHLDTLRTSGREVLLCGDVNIAHHPIDLKNWKGNQKNSGFLPEERAWMTGQLDAGWVDVHRALAPGQEVYTWWSNRGAAYAKNVGWRIDYQLATAGVAAKAKAASVFTTQRFSDHAPLVIDYDWTL